MKTFFREMLHLHNKWVRFMLFTSVVIILGIIFFPVVKKEVRPPVVMMQVDSMMVEKSMVSTDTMSKNQPLMYKMEKTTASAPIQVQIVETKKPFDWKGTLTWVIGAINGAVLLFLNIKKLFVKGTPA